MAKSPLMYGGDLRAIDDTTLSLITNPLLLDINAHSINNHEVSVLTLLNSNYSIGMFCTIPNCSIFRIKMPIILTSFH
jgi:hypothetical protein